MAQTVEAALRQAKLYSDGEVYRVLSLPPNAIMAAAGVLAQVGEAFSVLIADKDEVTLVLSEGNLEDFGRRLPGHRASDARYRLITFDMPLEPTLIGFMARVSRALADDGVTIFPYAAFDRDHLLVPADQYDKAIAALEALRK